MRPTVRLVGCAIAAFALLATSTATAQDDHRNLAMPPEVYLDRSGLNELVLHQTAFGAQIGSALTLAIFEDPARQAAGGLIGAGLGLGLPIALTRERPVPSGDVVYINGLQRIGMYNAILGFALLEPQLGPQVDDLRIFMGMVAGGSLLGMGAALITKDALAFTPGQAAAMGTLYTYGAATGALLMAMLDVAESPTGYAASILALANTGLAVGFLYRDAFDVNRSRVIWSTLGGVVGAGIGTGLAWLVGGEDVSPRLTAGGALVGLWAGAATTYLYLVPPDSYHNRADLPSTSLVEIGNGGSLSLGVPVPQALVLPSREASGAGKLVPAVNLLEWRQR